MATDRAVEVARVYDEEVPDGARVLVDRLWPRGVSKQDAALDDWAKDVAPSDELRRWYGHDPERFDEFRQRYLAELEDDDARDHLRTLASMARDHGIVLLTATREVEHSHAVVLAHVLRGMM